MEKSGPTVVRMPSPHRDTEFPLMRALELRRSKRKWSDCPLTAQEISDLLWAACGITREETKRSKSRRTAPSASNSQVIRLYLATGEGLFLYEEKDHSLIHLHSEDLREDIGTQKMMKSAPLGLIYVADFSRLNKYLAKDEARKWFVSGTDAAFISQNVYLYCAAAGLNTVILGFVDREKLQVRMKLRECEKVVYTQVVGRPPD